MNSEPDRYSIVISNLVRFGYGYRTISSGRQYYAWHGYPSRNDDFITYAEISQAEFEAIRLEYPEPVDAVREEAELFRKKYVEAHPVLAEGWNIPLKENE
ncbi:MAG: hypothetical protein J6S26_06230 [Solobacterium sp.]|nr:hypothetical protein [Solobacterium sp.]